MLFVIVIRVGRMFGRSKPNEGEKIAKSNKIRSNL